MVAARKLTTQGAFSAGRKKNLRTALNDKTMKFLTNHKETELVQAVVGEPIELINHPYIDPDWSVDDVCRECADVIAQAVDADKLILNGDYTLVSLIVLARAAHGGKPTGFVCFKKIGESVSKKNADGTITHSNVLQPVNVRWL